jgi:hypothetical protein
MLNCIWQPSNQLVMDTGHVMYYTVQQILDDWMLWLSEYITFMFLGRKFIG